MADKTEWLRCRPWIEAGLVYTRGTHTIEDIEDGIETGKYRFFSSPNAAVVVQIIEYPQMKVLNYFLGGGNLDEAVAQIYPPVTAWAQSMGCKRSSIIGRPGFLKKLLSFGCRYGWTMIYKDL